MLFLGTEKYPEENAYADYLGRHGGAGNAYTDMEDTNYYFHVGPGALPGALDRLAQFFVAPLFDPSMLERELRAVDSEWRNGRTSDRWRQFQLLKCGSARDHPFAKFGCGNYHTLTDGGDASREEGDEGATFGGGFSPREELVRFWTNKVRLFLCTNHQLLSTSEFNTFNCNDKQVPCRQH